MRWFIEVGKNAFKLETHAAFSIQNIYSVLLIGKNAC